MENITGMPVVDANYLRTRLFLVDELRGLIRESSIIIEAPRRYGKTSLVKEFVSEENKKTEVVREFNILFFELEGEETINHFCYAFFKELLNLYRIRKKIDMLSTLLGDFWNAADRRLPKVKIPQFEIELREQTRNFDFNKWREKIEPLVFGLNSFDKRTVIVFDEFPDMLLNFKNRGKESLGFKEATDTITAWLRSLRQKTESGCKYQFVFCGSINLRKTLEDLGIGKRINDLETLRVPPMKNEEAVLLIRELMKKYQIEIDKEGIEFMAGKITDGSPYYGQILFKALRDAREREFAFPRIQSVYDAMLRGGDHDLNHFHARLQDYLVTAVEKECSTTILKHLCSNSLYEKEIYDSYLFKICSNEIFQSVVNRLIYEGYIMRDTADNGKLKFVSPLLKDWWACKTGVK